VIALRKTCGGEFARTTGYCSALPSKNRRTSGAEKDMGAKILVANPQRFKAPFQARRGQCRSQLQAQASNFCRR
jgi:hypothetical protein